MWWRSWAKNAPSKTTGQGNPIIFTPNGQFYLDYQEDKNSVANIYNYDPMSEIQNAEMQPLVLGVQGNVWCEWIPSRERMQYMAIPRLLLSPNWVGAILHRKTGMHLPGVLPTNLNASTL